MQHFYDGQIRRYITQLVRLFSNFSYKDSQGNLVEVPVVYGDLTRQVGNILRDNSENKVPSAPRMAVYITSLELDTTRLADSSYISKMHIRERAYDDAGQEYLNEEGKNYTVERLMPTPYTLGVNVDIWSTNTDQKLQIMEQILMLFNPSLEIQTTDNYVDWTSLTVVNLDTMTWSSRSIPQGTESEIDIGTLGLTSPIYISPPAKVKRLGVITKIIQSMYLDGDIDLTGEGEAVIVNRLTTDENGQVTNEQTNTKLSKSGSTVTSATTHRNHNLLVLNNSIQLVNNGVVGAETWTGYLKALPFVFEPGITQIKLKRTDYDNEIAGTMAIDPADETVAVINWDEDTLPSDTVLHGPMGDRTKIDYIIDPSKTNPQSLDLSSNPRVLLLGDIGNAENLDGPDAFKAISSPFDNLVASANDIIEWDGERWSIVFDADQDDSAGNNVYVTNLNTGIQYKFENGEWLLSFEGEYPNGSWRIVY